MAVAPAARASSNPITRVAAGVAAATQPLTSASTSATSAGVMGRPRLKSNRSRSALQSDPCWHVSGPRTRFSAACSRCVAVWCVRMRRRRPSSTVAVTASPTRSAPDRRVAAWTKRRPPAPFWTSRTSSSAPPAADCSRPRSPTWPPDSA
jgi:hypothetical protein